MAAIWDPAWGLCKNELDFQLGLRFHKLEAWKFHPMSAVAPLCCSATILICSL